MDHPIILNFNFFDLVVPNGSNSTYWDRLDHWQWLMGSPLRNLRKRSSGGHELGFAVLLQVCAEVRVQLLDESAFPDDDGAIHRNCNLQFIGQVGGYAVQPDWGVLFDSEGLQGIAFVGGWNLVLLVYLVDEHERIVPYNYFRSGRNHSVVVVIYQG